MIARDLDKKMTKQTNRQISTCYKRFGQKIDKDNQTNFYQARALRALGLLLADGTPTVGGGKTF